MWPSLHRNANSNLVSFNQYEYYCVNYFWLLSSSEFAMSSACVNIWRGKHSRKIQIFWSSLRFRCQRIFCIIFGVQGFFLNWSWPLSQGQAQFLGCTFHLPSAETNLAPICTSPKSFVFNFPDSERHMTRPNQGLSTGRRGNLGMRLFTNQVKRKFEFPVTPLEAQSKDFGTASQMLLTRVKLPLCPISTLCP